MSKRVKERVRGKETEKDRGRYQQYAWPCKRLCWSAQKHHWTKHWPIQSHLPIQILTTWPQLKRWKACIRTDREKKEKTETRGIAIIWDVLKRWLQGLEERSFVAEGVVVTQSNSLILCNGFPAAVTWQCELNSKFCGFRNRRNEEPEHQLHEEASLFHLLFFG